MDHYGTPAVEVVSISKLACAQECHTTPWCLAWTYRAPLVVPPFHYNILPGICVLRQGPSFNKPQTLINPILNLTLTLSVSVAVAVALTLTKAPIASYEYLVNKIKSRSITNI